MSGARHSYEYPRPAATADAVVWRIEKGKLQTLLIRRGAEPFAGCWAIPGGFVNEGERLVDAAARELQEETGLEAPSATVGLLWPVGAYGDPGRDPRGWTISAAFHAASRGAEAMAADDAKEIGWHAVKKLPPLAFDHAEIIADAWRRLRRDARVLPVAAGFLPPSFELAELHAAYRAFDPETPAEPKPFAKFAAALPFLRPVGKSGRLAFRAFAARNRPWR